MSDSTKSKLTAEQVRALATLLLSLPAKPTNLIAVVKENTRAPERTVRGCFRFDDDGGATESK